MGHQSRTPRMIRIRRRRTLRWTCSSLARRPLPSLPSHSMKILARSSSVRIPTSRDGARAWREPNVVHQQNHISRQVRTIIQAQSTKPFVQHLDQDFTFRTLRVVDERRPAFVGAGARSRAAEEVAGEHGTLRGPTLESGAAWGIRCRARTPRSTPLTSSIPSRLQASCRFIWHDSRWCRDR